MPVGRSAWRKWCWIASVGALALHAKSRGPVTPAKRPVRIEDAIEMTRLAAPDEPVAAISPDGRHFVILVKKGNLTRNTNDYSLLLYRTADALQSPQAELLVEMSSSSNREAIKQIEWLRDSRHITFVGETAGAVPQVYSVDVRSKRVRQLTRSAAAIESYDTDENGRDLVYVTDRPPERPDTAFPLGLFTVGEGSTVSEFLAGSCTSPSNYPKGEQLYVQRERQKPVLVPLPEDYLADWSRPLHISPDGTLIDAQVVH